jgi:hypothetical protein
MPDCMRCTTVKEEVGILDDVLRKRGLCNVSGFEELLARPR